MTAFQRFVADLDATLELADVRAAGALVVDVYDPETDRHVLYGPFAKDSAEAQTWVAGMLVIFEAGNEGAPLVPTVRLLFEP